jgi:hypothetical protein
MKKLAIFLFLACAAGGALVRAATLYIPAYPNSILVFDEAKGQVVERIPLSTGLPTGLRLSQDRKKIYVITNDHSGVEVIDVATRKVISHFVLDTADKRYRFFAGTPDPEDKVLYTITTQIDKQVDRYEIGKPKYTVISLADGKISKTFDLPRDEENNGSVRSGGGFEVSPDGKFLYQFGPSVKILSTEDFKVVDTIDLSKPDLPGMEQVGVGGTLDSLSEPGHRISLFNSSDPIVHSRLFGIARFDLNYRPGTTPFEFTPIGPPPNGMAGLQVAPDRKSAYTVISSGGGGNKRCEFWAFDLVSTKIAKTAEVPCRSRFSFGMSGDGKKLYIYGAGFEIEVYDAATLKYEKTWDLGNDVTGNLIVLP